MSVPPDDSSNHNPFPASGLHMLQSIISCDLQGDGSKRGFCRWLIMGRLLLTPMPPVVTVTRRVEAEDGKETHICRVHGFYPRAVNASWTRDGEVWLQDTIHGSVAPNADGTYHYWLSIQIDPEERGHYRCHMEHDGLQESLDMALKGEGRQGGKGWALWQAGGLWERNLTPAVSRCDPT
uniref:Ig-like domain-containing protein n=1 Tax=Naja naja TaxID=35670 RepID=A0A8C6XDN2_NAJNA